MKMDRIIGVILSIIVVIILYGKNYTENYSQIVDNSFGLLDSNASVEGTGVKYGNVVLDMDNFENVDVITYTNKASTSITLDTSNISVTCKGTGENAKRDEALVEKNIDIKAAFSKSHQGNKYDSLEVLKKEKVYVFVTSKFMSKEYPQNEVTCEYTISLLAS